jgi:hypothetical integral membrane protein (TIGR02206 family)
MDRIRALLEYFFGKGEEIEFSIFTLAHVLPIIAMITVILFIYAMRNKLAASKNEMRFRYFLAFVMVISEMAYYWRIAAVPSLGITTTNDLPISVCGWAVILGSYMVVGKSQKMFDVIYFWLLTASIFALLTPTVLTYTGPTRFRYYQFWILHTIGYIAVFYMVFVHKMRPTVKSAVRSWCALVILTAVAYVANLIVGDGANYLYMARPEAAPSVLDILPPNFALRLAVMAAVITSLYFVAYLPWLILDIKANRVLAHNTVDLIGRNAKDSVNKK